MHHYGLVMSSLVVLKAEYLSVHILCIYFYNYITLHTSTYPFFKKTTEILQIFAGVDDGSTHILIKK